MERGRHGGEAAADRAGPSTQSHTTSSASGSDQPEPGRTDSQTHTPSRLQSAGSASIDSLKARVPRDIPCHSINGTFRGTFHLHEYLNSAASSSSYSRLRACVSQDGVQGRMTPREAEMRAGKGSRKSWKLTLMTTHLGQEMNLQRYFMLQGVEKPGHSEPVQRQDPSPTAAPEPAAADAGPTGSLWAEGWGEEPNSKRQHLQGPFELARRSTEESGTGAWMASSPASLAALSRTSNQDMTYLSARPSVGTQSLPDMHDMLGPGSGLQYTTLGYPLSRTGPALSMGFPSSVQTNTSLLASLAAVNRAPMHAAAPDDNMEALLRQYELNKRLSGSGHHPAGQTQQMPSSSSFALSGLGGRDLDRWPQQTLLNTGGGLLHNQARPVMANPSYLPSTSMVHQLLPVSPQPLTYMLQQGGGMVNLGQPLATLSRPASSQHSGGLYQRPSSITSHQPLDRLLGPMPFEQSRLSETSGHHRYTETSARPVTFQLPHHTRTFDPTRPGSLYSEPDGSQRLSDPGFSTRRSLTGAASGDQAAGPSHAGFGSRPQTPTEGPEASPADAPSLDKPDLSQVPFSIPIFTQNQEVSGTLYLHDYVTGTVSRPNRPPACVGLPGSDTLVTPRVAEAKAGREARKNWKESFRTTLADGRVISLKAYFAMHNIN